MPISALFVSATILAAPGKGEVTMCLFRNIFDWALNFRTQDEEDPYPGVWNLVPTYDQDQAGVRILEVGATTWEAAALYPMTWPRISLSVPDAEKAAEEVKRWAREHLITVEATYAKLRRMVMKMDGLAAHLWLASREPVIWRGRNDWIDICIRHIPSFLAANRVLEIVLPQKEYERLRDGGLGELKRGVSPEAAGLLWLQDDYEVTIGNEKERHSVLLLCRTGRCH